MKLSILMITYNHEPFVCQAINGVLMQQTNFDYELIIANDCSTDNTDAAIKECLSSHKNSGNVNYFVHPKNLGIRDNFKFAHDKASGEYIAICEGDDYWTEPGKLQKQVDFLEQNINYSLCYTRFKTLNEDNKELKIDFNGKYFSSTDDSVEFDFEKFQKGWHVGNQTLMFRNSQFDQSVYQRYKNLRDVHVITHLLNKGKGRCLNFISAVYRIHDGGMHSSVTTYDGYRKGFECHGEIYYNNKNNPYLKRKYLHSFQNFINANIVKGYFFKSLKLSIKLFLIDGSPTGILRNFMKIIKRVLKL